LIAEIMLRFTKRNPLMSRLVRLSGPLLTAANKINPVITDALNQHFPYMYFSPSSHDSFLELLHLRKKGRYINR
jgi:hypothetical protein